MSRKTEITPYDVRLLVAIGTVALVCLFMALWIWRDK